MNRILFALCCVLLLASTGCGKSDSASSGAGTEAPAAGTGGETAAASEGSERHAEGIVPGSYEDWCSEHEVLETKCTRCDASLVAAFKATGDWCEDHGLPKSQCKACDPTLVIARAPKPGTP